MSSDFGSPYGNTLNSYSAKAKAAPEPEPEPQQTIPELHDMLVEGAEDEHITDEMFEACRRAVTDPVLESAYKVVSESPMVRMFKDVDKDRNIRTYIHKQAPLGYPPAPVFELRISEEFGMDKKMYDTGIPMKYEDGNPHKEQISYRRYKMPPGISDREFCVRKRCLRNEATGTYEQITRSTALASFPGTKLLRAFTFLYVQVEQIPGNPKAHVSRTLAHTDLKGGLQAKMSGPMQKELVKRADEEIKKIVKQLTPKLGAPIKNPKPGIKSVVKPISAISTVPTSAPAPAPAPATRGSAKGEDRDREKEEEEAAAEEEEAEEEEEEPRTAVELLQLRRRLRRKKGALPGDSSVAAHLLAR